MILLDTNVLSELMRVAPEPRVVQWLDSCADEDVWVNAVTEAEILLGIQLLPEGRRRTELADLAGRMFEEEFSGRCLPFDAGAAVAYAEIVASRTRLGSPISVEDAQIAAIARTGGLAVATRNVKDFEGIEGLQVINPWDG
ncbi:MAG: PIN domain-containing protein [Candidatus Methylomirabilia bacterium]